MELEHLTRKFEQDKKAKERSPYKRTTIIPLGNGQVRMVTEKISRKEWLEDNDVYIDNPEDPDFRREMEGEC
jgi:hypothetical protein